MKNYQYIFIQAINNSKEMQVIISSLYKGHFRNFLYVIIIC